MLWYIFAFASPPWWYYRLYTCIRACDHVHASALCVICMNIQIQFAPNLSHMKFFNMKCKGRITNMLSHTAETFSRRGTAAEPRPLPLLISRCLFIGLQGANSQSEPVYKPSLQSSVCFITSCVHSASGQWSLSFFFFKLNFLFFFLPYVASYTFMYTSIHWHSCMHS